MTTCSSYFVPIPKLNLTELDDWLNKALTQHPAIQAARQQTLAAQEKITTTRSESLSSIDFVTNFYQNGFPNQGLQQSQFNTTNVSLVLNIPLFDGFAGTYKIRESQALKEKSQAQ